MNPSLDTAPAPAAPVFDVRTLSNEEAHAFGVRVALMARDLGAARERLAETEQRLAAVLADNEALRRRVRGQTDTITRLQKADAPPAPEDLLDRIEAALTAPCAASHRPELLGSAAPVVEPVDPDDDEGDGEDIGSDGWVCAPPKPSTMVGPVPASGWFGWLRWRR